MRFLFLMAFSVLVASSEGFQCRNSAVNENSATNETTSEVEELDDIVDSGFDKVSLGLALDKCKNQKFLAPKTIHWHLIAIPETETPKISMFPNGLVKPFVRGSTLKFDFQSDVTQDLFQGETIQAGISIFLPPHTMKKIIVEGVDEVVEISNNLTSSELGFLTIDNSGIDNTLYMASPNSVVDYVGSGVDNYAILEIGPGSMIDLSGIDQEIRIKTSDESDIDITMSGIGQHVTIEGGYSNIDVSGIDAKVYVNGPNRCDHIKTSGIDNGCSITEETVSVPQLECLATSTVQEWHCSHWGFTSKSAAIGGGIGILLFLILCCILSCWGCYRCSKNGDDRLGEGPIARPVQKYPHDDYVQKIEEGHSVVEAEVTGIDDQSRNTAMSSMAGEQHDDPKASSKTASSQHDQEVVEAEIIVDATPTTNSPAEEDLFAAETGLGKTG